MHLVWLGIIFLAIAPSDAQLPSHTISQAFERYQVRHAGKFVSNELENSQAVKMAQIKTRQTLFMVSNGAADIDLSNECMALDGGRFPSASLSKRLLAFQGESLLFSQAQITPKALSFTLERDNNSRMALFSPPLPGMRSVSLENDTSLVSHSFQKMGLTGDLRQGRGETLHELLVLQYPKALLPDAADYPCYHKMEDVKENLELKLWIAKPSTQIDQACEITVEYIQPQVYIINSDRLYNQTDCAKQLDWNLQTGDFAVKENTQFRGENIPGLSGPKLPYTSPDAENTVRPPASDQPTKAQSGQSRPDKSEKPSREAPSGKGSKPEPASKPAPKNAASSPKGSAKEAPADDPASLPSKQPMRDASGAAAPAANSIDQTPPTVKKTKRKGCQSSSANISLFGWLLLWVLNRLCSAQTQSIKPASWMPRLRAK